VFSAFTDHWGYSLLHDNSFAANCILQSGAISSNDMKTGASLDPSSQMQVSQDYLRYLARSIFGTPAGVDLFYNETQVVDEINTSLNSIWNTSIVNGILKDISTGTPNNGDTIPPGNDPHLKTDLVNGNKYLDNSDPAGAYKNVSQTIFNQLLTQQPGRFTTDGNGLISDTGDHQQIPLIAGDSISFSVQITPAAGQESIVSGTTNIDSRTYRIKMILG
jgi:hypothetical protein